MFENYTKYISHDSHGIFCGRFVVVMKKHPIIATAVVVVCVIFVVFVVADVVFTNI